MTLLLILLITSTDIFETEETRDYDLIIAETEYLKAHPIDINRATIDDLMRIPYLSAGDCMRIIDLRNKTGRINSWEQLAASREVDPLTISRIKPYLTFAAKPYRRELLKSRLRWRQAISDQHANDYYTRNQALFAGHHDLFLVSEQDAGESSFFDYWAGGLLVNDGARRFAMGAYDLDLGSGVMLSSVGSIFQATDFRVASVERGIVPYMSAMENNAFFGAAYGDSLPVPFALFFSNRKLDGRVDTAGIAWSLDMSGDHSDSAGLARKDRIDEEIMGYNVGYAISGLVIGHRSYVCTYTPQFATTDSLFGFYGRRFWMSGFSARYRSNNFILFSEAARADRNRLGGLFGLGSIFPFRTEFSIAGKYFPAGYYSPKGVESRDDYFGLTADIGQTSFIARLGATLNISSPASAESTSYDLKFNFEKNMTVIDSRIQLRWKMLETDRELSGAKIFVRFRPVGWLYCDVRLEEKHVYTDKDSLDRGMFVSCDLGVDAGRFDVKTRYGVFDADSYDARIFAYEPDLPGIISNRILYGQGQYGILYLSVKPARKVSVSAKYTALRKISTNHYIGTQVDFNL
jgi:hypothetical protein